MAAKKPWGSALVLAPFFFLIAVSSFLFSWLPVDLEAGGPAMGGLQNTLLFEAYRITSWLGPIVLVGALFSDVVLKASGRLSEATVLATLLLLISVIAIQFCIAIIIIV